MSADIERTISNSRSGKRAAAVRDNRHTKGNAPTEAIELNRHTPGPWRHCQYGYLYAMVPSENEYGIPGAIVTKSRLVCSLQVDNPNINADAALIAAAPEMLEALRACLSVLPYGNESIDLMARAAIAKATGGK